MQAEKQVLDRLGNGALDRVLADTLDHTRLVRLATACGLTYPGTRTRSQKRERLVTDLVAKANNESVAWKSMLRALKKETAAAARAWGRLKPDERERRLGDERYLLSGGKLGLHLFISACSRNGPEDDAVLKRLIALKDRPLSLPRDADAADAKIRKELARLKKRDTELRKKLAHHENQLAKSRETEKRLKKDLIERKGDLAESRMLAERLQRDLDKLRRSAGLDAGGDGVQALSDAINKISTQQRKLAHAVSKLSPAPRESTRDASADGAQLIEALGKEFAALRRHDAAQAKAMRERLDEIRDQLRVSKRSVKASKASAAAVRRRGTPERVGAFIDVQNVYYGARQLKGKLDFDALLSAIVRDRRLIQATAYVVESKEIDQSGFIARLQQQAISVRRKTLKVRSDGSMKGDWDMEMALDILDAAPNLNVVVLVSGDGDFTSLVKRVKSMGPRVEVIAFPRTTAKSLVQSADRFQPLGREFMIRTPEARAKPRQKAERVAKRSRPDRPAEKPAANPGQ